MKKLLFIAVILCSCLFFKNADAQINFSVGLNIGNQPDWGPVGYDHADYYYIPDIDGYYDINAHQYIYLDNNVWVHRGYLPPRYRNYDLYHGYKVVVNNRNPWLRNSYYRSRYAGYRGRKDQAMIRDSHDARYRNHWHGAENHREQQLNQRAAHEDQRAAHENQRARQLNQKQRHLDKKAKDQDHHDHDH